MRQARKAREPGQRHTNQGWVEAATRIVGALLRSTRYKDSLRVIVNHLDEDSASGLVRVALTTDPALTMALLGATPRAANIVVEATAELAAQLAGKPRALVHEASSSLWQRVRVERAGEAAGSLLALALEGGARNAERGRLARQQHGDGTDPSGIAPRFWTGFSRAIQGQLGCTPLEAVAPLLVRWLEALAAEAARTRAQQDGGSRALEELIRAARKLQTELTS